MDGRLNVWAKRLGLVLLGLVVAVHVLLVMFRFLPTPGTINMLSRKLDGAHIARVLVNVDAVSPHVVRAVIAAEDTRFCQHGGIDVEAIEKAMDEAEAGGRRRGASTITQQTAKNVFLWNGGGYARKAAEAWFALLSDRIWGKRRTMEMYLNVTEWGDGIFGIEAAARLRFNKSAKDLTEREAALLAAVLPSPNKWRVDPPGPYVNQRTGTIQARMRVVERDGLAKCVLGTR